MTPFRAFALDHRTLAGLLLGLALLMKALVPAGYMIGTQGQMLTVEICTDASNAHLTKQLVIPLDGTPDENRADYAKSDVTCPFSTLAMGAIGGADPALLLAALAFILLLGFLPGVPLLRERPAFLWPPLRGPPAFA